MSEHSTPATNSTRASLLKRLGFLATGALGGGIAVRAAQGGDETPAPVTAPTRTTRELQLYGREWRLQRPGVEFGKLPTAGDPVLPAGVIVDGRGREVGRFHAAALQSAEAFHLHTFELQEGTIHGIGPGTLDAGSYAVVGGTGRFAGASGTYEARQFLRELGGDGTAEFTFNLSSWEA